LVEMILAGEDQCAWRESCPSTTLSAINSTWSILWWLLIFWKITVPPSMVTYTLWDKFFVHSLLHNYTTGHSTVLTPFSQMSCAALHWTKNWKIWQVMTDWLTK
jgi:hypothetical protein